MFPQENPLEINSRRLYDNSNNFIIIRRVTYDDVWVGVVHPPSRLKDAEGGERREVCECVCYGVVAGAGVLNTDFRVYFMCRYT